jgi:ABC-type sugar transport system ATPase subunit
VTVTSDLGELVMRGGGVAAGGDLAASGGVAAGGDLTASADLAVGHKVIFCFRPEDVVLAGADSRNRVRGKIEQQIFMGNLTDLFVDVGGVSLRAQMRKGGNLRKGDPIELSIPEDAFRILEREGDA